MELAPLHGSDIDIEDEIECKRYAVKGQFLSDVLQDTAV